MAKPGLTDKQKKFVDEYLIDLNATQAAIRACYSKKTANVIAGQNLSKLSIQEAIQEAFDKRAERTGITQDKVLAELNRIAFSDMRQFANWGSFGITLRDSGDLTMEDVACIEELSETEGPKATTTKFKLHNKLKALELLGKHLGMFKDDSALLGNINITIVDNIPKSKPKTKSK